MYFWSVACCRISCKAILVSSLRVFSNSQFRCVTHLYLHIEFMYKLSTVIYSIHFVTVYIFSWRTRKIYAYLCRVLQIESGRFWINNSRIIFLRKTGLCMNKSWNILKLIFNMFSSVPYCSGFRSFRLLIPSLNSNKSGVPPTCCFWPRKLRKSIC